MDTRIEAVLDRFYSELEDAIVGIVDEYKAIIDEKDHIIADLEMEISMIVGVDDD